MRLSRRHFALSALLLLAAIGWFLFIHRPAELRQLHDWRAHITYATLGCRHCSGQTESLSYNGTPIEAPNWRWATDDGSPPMVKLVTPIGRFTAHYGISGWRFWKDDIFFEDIDAPISPHELEQGWYDAVPADRTGFTPAFGVYIRKPGTPDHWCLLATFDHGRWVAPDMISKLDW